MPVTGTVTHNGAAVEGALVTFHAAGVTAFDTTDAEGKFSLKTRVGDGAEPGKYVVTVSKSEQSAPPEVPTDPMDVATRGGQAGTGGAQEMLSSGVGQAPPTTSLLPAVYSTLIQTPLRDYSVTVEGPNDFPIVISDDAAPAAELPAAQPVGT